MTGRELIMYILQNNLEDEEVFQNGIFLGCMTAETAAANLGVGTATVRAWVDIAYLDGVTINDVLYILPNYKYSTLFASVLSNTEVNNVQEI